MFMLFQITRTAQKKTAEPLLDEDMAKWFMARVGADLAAYSPQAKKEAVSGLLKSGKNAQESKVHELDPVEMERIAKDLLEKGSVTRLCASKDAETLAYYGKILNRLADELYAQYRVLVHVSGATSRLNGADRSGYKLTLMLNGQAIGPEDTDARNRALENLYNGLGAVYQNAGAKPKKTNSELNQKIQKVEEKKKAAEPDAEPKPVEKTLESTPVKTKKVEKKAEDKTSEATVQTTQPSSRETGSSGSASTATNTPAAIPSTNPNLYPAGSAYRMQGGDNLRNREEYRTLFNQVRDRIAVLTQYSNLDDLVSLESARTALADGLSQLQLQIGGLDKSAQATYNQKLKTDLIGLRSELPSYLQGAISETGALDQAMLYNATQSLITTTRNLNALDAKLGLALQGPLGMSDVQTLRTLTSQLEGYPQALRYVLAQRYGANGEGLAGAREAMGLGASTAPVEQQYLEIAKSLTDTNHSELWGLSAIANQRYPKSYNGDPGDSTVTPIVPPTYGLLSATSTVLVPGASETRASFDFVSRIAFLRLVSGEMPDTVRDAQLGQMMLSSANMAPGHAALVFSRPFFNDVLGALGTETAGTLSSEELKEYNDSSTSSSRRAQLLAKVGGVRQQVFNQAVLLLNAIYANSAPEQRYDNARDLMQRFEKLALSGNLVSDLESRHVSGLSQGHIEPKAPYEFVNSPYQRQDISTLWTFASSMYSPTSLFAYDFIPDVQAGQALKTSDLNYLFDRAQWARNLYLSNMPSAWYLQVDYAPNYLGKGVNYGQLLGSMNEAFSQVSAKLISTLEPRYHTASLQSSGQEGKGAADLSWATQGRRLSQRASAEAEAEWGATSRGTTYSPTQYSVYDKGTSEKEYAQLQASQIQVLGTNLWQAAGSLNRTATANERDASGNKIDVGGLADATEHWDYNLHLNSTFPLAAEGTTIAFVNGKSDMDYPALETFTYGADTSASFVALLTDQNVKLVDPATNRTYTNTQMKTLLDNMTDSTQTSLQDTDGKTYTINKNGQGAFSLYKPHSVGTQTTTSRYDIDIFVKKDGTWVRAIAKDRTSSLLRVKLGGGQQTFQDSVDAYFAQMYSELGNDHRADTAVEVDDRRYRQKTENASGTRYGAMLIYQPPQSMVAGGGAISTAQNATLFGGFEGSANIVEAGFYSFNPSSGPRISLSQGGVQYYQPSYELYEKQPDVVPNLLSEKRNLMMSGSWLALQQFRATVFGGWQGQDQGILVGEEMLTRQSNVSSFFHFDSQRYLSEAIVSAGGKTRKLDVGIVELEDVRAKAYALRSASGDEAAFASGFKMGDGQMVLSGRVNSKRTGTTPLTERTVKGLFDRYDTLRTQVASASLDELMDVEKRATTYREWMNLALPIAADGVQLQPINDLYTSWLANFSIGYKKTGSRAIDGLLTTAITEDGGTFASGLFNYDSRTAFIGGVRIGGNETNTPDSAYRWLFGAKLRPSDEMAFSLYATQIQDKRMLGNLTAELRDVGLVSASGGKDYYAVSLSMGDQNLTGLINLSEIGGLHSAEIGGRVALGTAMHLAMAYRNVTMPGLSGFDKTDALVQQAIKQDLLPSKLSFDQFKTDLYFNMGDNSILTLTGQLRSARGAHTPYDFYFGGRFSWSP